MKLHRHLFGLMAALALGLFSSSASSASSTMDENAWITIGDAAFRQVRQFVPDVVSIESRRLAGGGETIHAISLSASRLEALAGALHQRLQQCGGFVFHKTEAQARAALRNTAATGAAPSYAIDNRELVEPMLAQMSDKNIEQTIVSLSGFPNRYYRSPSGVDASSWLLTRWSVMAEGRPDITVTQFTHADYPQKSVMLSIAGSDKPDECIVLGASRFHPDVENERYGDGAGRG
jgi:leucyl aminopeptidase